MKERDKVRCQRYDHGFRHKKTVGNLHFREGLVAEARLQRIEQWVGVGKE